jgi:ParB family transcriptional regulator, chromosome partitioning protein
MIKKDKKALGRGLHALISTRASHDDPQVPLTIDEKDAPPIENSKVVTISEEIPYGLDTVRYLEISKIRPNPTQPRRTFVQEELQELIESIRELGIIQPLVVRPLPDGFYEIIAGERRWRASQEAGLTLIPVLVKDVDDTDTLKLALVENLQRSQLLPIEEAQGFERLINEYGLTQEQVGQAVSKPRSQVANTLRLLRLPEEVKTWINQGLLSSGHGKVLLSLKDVNGQFNLAKKCLEESLSVRALEALVAKVQVLDTGKGSSQSLKSPIEPYAPSFAEDVVNKLRTALGTRVTLKHSLQGKGKIEVHYFSEDDLDRVIEVITR